MAEQIMVPVRYLGAKPWETDNRYPGATTWHEDSTLGPFLEPYPQDQVRELLDRFPGLFQVEGNAAYTGLSRDELVAEHRTRFGRAPLSRLTDAEVVLKLQQDDEARAEAQAKAAAAEPVDHAEPETTPVDSDGELEPAGSDAAVAPLDDLTDEPSQSVLQLDPEQ